MPAHADLLQRWFTEVWNEGRTDSVYELLAPDAVVHGLGEPGRDAQGPAGFLPFFERFRGTFPDVHFTVDDVVESGDKAAARWHAHMHHRGTDLGPAATEREVAVTGMSFVRIRDGQLAEGWNNWDTLEMVKQIEGLQPAATLMPEG